MNIQSYGTFPFKKDVLNEMRCGAYMCAGISSRPVALDGLRFVKSLKTFSVPLMLHVFLT